MSDQQVKLKMDASTDRYLALGVDDGTTEDADNRFELLADGKIQWGDGTSDQDTNLYRSAADTLKTDDSFIAGATVLATAGYKETVTAGTTAATLSNNGTAYLANTTAGTFLLAVPVAGMRKTISCGTTITHTINPASTDVEFGTTGGKGVTLAAKDASVTLVGRSSSQWLIVGTYTTAGGFSITTGA